MIDIIRGGNIFASRCTALVCPSNCVGVAGGGLALDFRNHFPGAHAEYVAWCRRGLLVAGGAPLFTPMDEAPGRYVVWFPTKNHWRHPSELQWIDDGLGCLELMLQDFVDSVAVPKLGCGLGGLNWSDVFPLIERRLCAIDRVEVYE